MTRKQNLPQGFMMANIDIVKHRKNRKVSGGERYLDANVHRLLRLQPLRALFGTRIKFAMTWETKSRNMFSNYFKVALRALRRNKTTTFINIAGLTFALMCCLLIALFIGDELSYDKFHTKADRIYRVTREFRSPDGSVSLHLGHVAPPFGPLLKNDFPEFESVARTLKVDILIAREENGQRLMAFNEDRVFFAEPEILDIFDFSIIAGNAREALEKPFHVLLSRSTAKRFFGDESAIGKSLNVNNDGELLVSGLFEDFPDESHWHPNFLIAFSSLNDSTIYGRRSLETNWGNNAFPTYVLVKEPFVRATTEAQFPAFLDRHMSVSTDAKPSTWTSLYL